MVEYILYKADMESPITATNNVSWYANGDWIDSIYRSYNKITKRNIVKNTKEMLLKHNCPFGKYNIDLIKGPKSIVMDCYDYECCIGYANIEYTKNGIIIVDKSFK